VGAQDAAKRLLEATPVVADEDEYDLFAGLPLTPPAEGEEASDAVHADEAQG
jgi:hypothetical protein